MSGGVATQPLKLAIVAAVAAATAGMVLSRKIPPETAASPPPTAAATSLAAPAGSGSSVLLEPDAAGHFHADAEIAGTIVPMIVDTGASVVALTADDAARVGLRPMPSDYTMRVATANGTALAAPVRIREIRIGRIAARDVPAAVMPAGLLPQSLLGMSFLSTLGRVQMGARQLVLTP